MCSEKSCSLVVAGVANTSVFVCASKYPRSISSAFSMSDGNFSRQLWETKFYKFMAGFRRSFCDVFKDYDEFNDCQLGIK